jgi:hypothetical protein
MTNWKWLALAAISTMIAIPAFAQKDIDTILKSIGGETIREVSSDIAYPADSEEYAELGKNAVVMLDASAAITRELPLRSVYLEVNDVRVPLQRLVVLPKYADPKSGKTHQISFYLIPIHHMKFTARLVADFSGARTGFGITNFPQNLNDAPAFVRLDETDFPEEPNSNAAAKLIAREWPSFFKAPLKRKR